MLAQPPPPRLATDPPCIALLVAARNPPQNSLTAFLTAWQPHVHMIILLDDASSPPINPTSNDDPSLWSPGLWYLLRKRAWIRSEVGDRNLLMIVGRHLGANRFVVPDYDEFPAGPCTVPPPPPASRSPLLSSLLALEPSQRLVLPWLEAWGPQLRSHRVTSETDPTNFLQRRIPIMFADPVRDHSCTEQERWGPLLLEKNKRLQIHYPRIPTTLTNPPSASLSMPPVAPSIFLSLNSCALVEFRFVSTLNANLKRAWYAAFGALHGDVVGALGRMDGVERQRERDGDSIHLAPIPPAWQSSVLLQASQSFEGVETWRLVDLHTWLGDELRGRSGVDWQALLPLMAGGEDRLPDALVEQHVNVTQLLDVARLVPPM